MHSSRCRRLVPRLVPRWLAHRLTRCRGRSLRSQPAGCAAPNHCEYRSWAPFCGLFCRQLCSSLVACDVPPRVAVRFRQHAMAYLVGLSTAHAVCRTLQRLPQHRREISRFELARIPHATRPAPISHFLRETGIPSAWPRHPPCPGQTAAGSTSLAQCALDQTRVAVTSRRRSHRGSASVRHPQQRVSTS